MGERRTCNAASSSAKCSNPAGAAPTCANECDCFLSAPADALRRRYARGRGRGRRRSALPSHVAMFDELYDDAEVREVLCGLGYGVTHRFFHELRRADGGWLGLEPRRLLLLEMQVPGGRRKSKCAGPN